MQPALTVGDAADPPDLAHGEHFSCVLSAVLLSRVYEFGGDGAVAATLRQAGSARPAGYLTDIARWISYEEGVALFDAGARVTHHPMFARAVGQDSARRLNGSPVATMLRSLGSPESVYRQIAVTGRKYSTVSALRALDGGPGRAHLEARPLAGFPRAAGHCEWTIGLLSCLTELFGLPPATVEHETCAAYGASACHYHVTWPAETGHPGGRPTEELDTLRDQLEAMKERLHSMFQTAADLIGSSSVDDVLARIAERAAVEVRAPRHLLAVRLDDRDELHVHQAGFGPEQARLAAARLLSGHPSEMPESWLAVRIRSNRRDYGVLLAAYPENAAFLPQERELLEVYARYAASALDSASALLEARSRYGQSSALLELARALSTAGTSPEIAQRVADSVPVVVDCDQVAVYVWNGTELVREAITEDDGVPRDATLDRWAPAQDTVLAGLLADPRPDPIFIDAASASSRDRSILSELGLAASVLVPLVSGHDLTGMLAVAVRDRAERLRPTTELLDRLSGVAAQAATALQNGRLVDLITHQAMHDQLTGLANRVQFTTELRQAVSHAEAGDQLACVFYLDLDHFKPVNDERGHDAGDALLASVAERLRVCTRTGDLVARLGGDEFAVLVTASSQADIERISERIKSAFDEPFRLAGDELRIAASVGRSIYPADAVDADELLRQADEAMFAHKRRQTDARPALREAPAV